MLSPYSKKVIELFQNPKNMGEMENPDAVGQKGNPTCGDVMKIYLKIEDNRIKDIKFQTMGCIAAISTSSMITELAKGKTLEEAFTQTAYSLMATISPNLKKISPNVEKTLKIRAEDKQALLFDFLSEFLYIFDVDGLIFSEINVNYIKKIDDEYELQANMKGEKFSRAIHELGIEVKAITYSFMNIEEKVNNVEINIVFDI